MDARNACFALGKAEGHVGARHVGVGRFDGEVVIVLHGDVEVALHGDIIVGEIKTPHLGMLITDTHCAKLVGHGRNLAAETLALVKAAVRFTIEGEGEGVVAVLGGIGTHARVGHEPR